MESLPLPPVPQLPADPQDRQRIMWKTIVNSTSWMVKPDALNYHLYHDSLQYLRAKHPQGWPECRCTIAPTGPGAAHWTGIEHIPRYCPSLGTIVNIIADKFPNPREISLHSFLTKFDKTSVIDFIIAGVLALKEEFKAKAHLTCILPAWGLAKKVELPKALFLDVVWILWGLERQRRADTDISTPLPWSRPSQYTTSRLIKEDLGASEQECKNMGALFGTPIDIPWFGAPHDGFPHCTTLSSYTLVRRRQRTVHSRRDDAALWLSALTFGVLEAVTRQRIPESVLIVPGAREGERVISGARVLRLLVHFYRSKPCDGGEAAQLAHAQQIADIVARALRALDEEAMRQSGIFYHAGYTESETDDIVCATALTILPLCAISRFKPDLSPSLPLQILCAEVGSLTKTRHFHLASLRSCRERMCRAGWCKSTIPMDFLAKFMNLMFVANLARLPPHIAGTDAEHAGCTESSCVLTTITDTDAYAARHIDPTCTCAPIKPPVAEVAKLLLQGTVPVVVYDGEILRVRPAADGPYVAISHVWADGMGSTTETGLPTCVVKRMASLVAGLHPEANAGFWMDSLCVPGSRDVRKRAIKLMAQTYRDAANVLVIDGCIRTLCSVDKPWEENLFRITTSGWMRRVWTLQEGLLARELFFEFREGPVNVDRVAGIKKPNREDGVEVFAPWTSPEAASQWTGAEATVYLWCLSHVPFLTFRAKQDAWKAGSKIDTHELISLLSLRNTTKTEDETVAISGLLSLDVDALLAITGPNAAQERMREFLVQIQEVPLVHAVQTAPRLELPGFGWAPRSLTTTPPSVFRGGSPNGHCTRFGLFGHFYVALLREPIALPVQSPSPSSRQLLVEDHASGELYSALKVDVGTAFPGCESTGHVLVDALLFVDDRLPTTAEPAWCAAVLKGEPLRLPGGATLDIFKDRPLPPTYFHAASVVLTLWRGRNMTYCRSGMENPWTGAEIDGLCRTFVHLL